MIVERISGAAKAIIKEFDSTKILELLQHAMNLSANRQGPNDQQYAVAAQEIRTKARNIIERDILNAFPQDMKRLFLDSGYGSALPSSIARVLYNGIKNDKLSTISSTELAVYQNAAHVLLLELNNMLSSFDKFKVDRILIPEGTISFDVLIPRAAFENDATRFVNVTKSFVDVMSDLMQLSINTRDKPALVYTSTSDPVTAIAVAVAAATPFLLFYDKLLDVAKKHIELLKLVKTARESSLTFAPEKNLEEQVKDRTNQSIANAVDEVVKVSAASDVSQGVASEIRTKITMKSSMIVAAIANGARVNVSVESEFDIARSFRESSLNYDEFKALQDHSRALELSVGENLKLLNSQSLLMIEHDVQPTQEMPPGSKGGT